MINNTRYEINERLATRIINARELGATTATGQYDWSNPRKPFGKDDIMEKWPMEGWRNKDDKHSHTIQTNTTKTGSSVSSANTTNQAIDIRPPYYVLAFIMRTK